MSKMLSKMNLISVVQQLPKEDIETIQGYVEMIEEENQELKLELSGYRQAILNNKEMLGLKEKNQELKKQNQELKKQLEERNIEYFKGVYDTHNKYYDQQKEFIKYLEDEIKQNTPYARWKHYNEDGFNDYDVENPSCIEVQPTDKVLKEVLQKYKSIIGVLDE